MHLIGQGFYCSTDQMCLPGSSGQSQDRTSCILVPVRSSKSCKSRNYVHSIGIWHRQTVFLWSSSILQKPCFISEPLDSSPCYKYTAFKGISWRTICIHCHSSQKSVTRLYHLISCVHQKKASCAICILNISRFETALAEQSCLLISCGSCNRDPATDQLLISITIDTAAWPYLWKHGKWYSKIIQDFLIPVLLMDVKQHCSGSIGVICYMYFTFGQLPYQPGIYCAKQKITLLCFFSCPFRMIQDPADLGSRKISIRNQSCLMPDHIWEAFLFQLLDHICSTSALPYDCRINRLPCTFVPNDGRFTLIGNTNGMNILCICADLPHCLYGNRQLRWPDLHRIMLHPAWLRIMLCIFFLGNTAHPALSVKQDTPWTGRSLIQCHNIFPHCRITSLCQKCFTDKVAKHQYAKNDPVPAKGFEIMAFDISHQKFDSQNGNHKCHYHSCKQDDYLCGGKLKTKFHNFHLIQMNL